MVEISESDQAIVHPRKEQTAGIAGDLKQLNTYRFSGHSAVIGRRRRPPLCQDTEAVLAHFADRVSLARRRYRLFIKNGIDHGRRPDLTGGGLLRSHGGWVAVKALRKTATFYKSDERILGDSDFVEQVLSEAKEQLERKYLLQAQGIDENQLIEIVARVLGVEPWQVCAAGKQSGRVHARSLFCYWAVRELGMTMTALSGNLNLSPAGISLAVKRGEEIARSGGFELERQLNIQN